MRFVGISLIVVSVIWGVIVFNMETTVKTESQDIGSDFFSLHIPSQTVHNLDLADRKRNHLIGAGITLISGILLLGFGSLTSKGIRSNVPEKKCPFCAEPIKREANICRYCGKDQPINEKRVKIAPVVTHKNKIRPYSISPYVLGGAIVIVVLFSVFIFSDLKKDVPLTSSPIYDANDSLKSTTSPIKSKSIKAEEIYSGLGKQAVVFQTMNSGGYSYIEVTNDKGTRDWLILPEVKVAKGDKIEYAGYPPEVNFHDRRLNKTFDKLFFIPGIRIVK